MAETRSVVLNPCPLMLTLRSRQECYIWEQRGSDWPQMGLFQIRFQYILARCAKMYWNLIWKNSGFVPFGAKLIRFWPKSGHLRSVAAGTFLIKLWLTICSEDGKKKKQHIQDHRFMNWYIVNHTRSDPVRCHCYFYFTCFLIFKFM